MKRLSVLVSLVIAPFAQPAGLHEVYLLPMAGGLDQYLTNWITREKLALVVTDPKAADLVMTDRLGEAFEQKMAQIRPEEKKPEEKKPDDKTDRSGASAGAGAQAGEHSSFHSTAVRGTLFLVDIKSRQVVWSDHEKPRGISDASLNREAERVAKKLQADFLK